MWLSVYPPQSGSHPTAPPMGAPFTRPIVTIGLNVNLYFILEVFTMTVDEFEDLLPYSTDEYKVAFAFGGSLKVLFSVDDVLISEKSKRAIITLGMPQLSDKDITVEEAIGAAIPGASLDEDFEVEEDNDNE